MNGWTNWDTWNCNPHMNNDEYTYRALMRCGKTDQIKDLWLTMFGEDHDGINMNEVDWDEILDNNGYYDDV